MKSLFRFSSAIGCLALATGAAFADEPVRLTPTTTVEMAPSTAVVSDHVVEPAVSADEVQRLIPVGPGGITARGWIDAGYIYNSSNPASRYNGPYNSVDRTKEAMFNQAYLILERGLPTTGEFGVGARVDLLYGEDFLVGQSNGLEKNPNGSSRWNGEYYGLAIPQSYLEAGTTEASVKVGHFYSIVGYEGLTSATNFFYSKAYSYQFAGPFTHWGALGTYNATDRIQLQFGLHNGWNTLDGTQDQVSFIAGAKLTGEEKNWWSSIAVTTGEENTNAASLPGIAPGYANRTRYSFIFDATPNDCLEYVFHQWLGFQENGTASGQIAYWYGLDQYLYYRLNDKCRAGGRAEWFRDEDGTRIGLNRSTNPNKPPFPGNAYSLSAGLNWQPICNLNIRPEVRWDWFDGTGRPYNDGNKTNQLTTGFDVIWQF